VRSRRRPGGGDHLSVSIDVGQHEDPVAELRQELALYDPLTMDAVDAFRKDHGLAFEGNPRGLVDERLVEALRAAYQKR
jgi:hypothetical protein